MKKLLALFLFLAPSLLRRLRRGRNYGKRLRASFIDILDHWAEEEICFLYSQNDIEGYSERNFLPDNDITRAEFLKSPS